MGSTISKTSIIRNLVIGFFFLLPIYINFFTYDAKNFLFIGYSILGIICILLLRRQIPMTITGLSPVLLALLTLSYVINISSSETISFLYSIFFVTSYICFVSYFKREVDEERFIAVVWLVVLAFFVTLVIGQAYVTLGFFKGVFITKGNTHGPFGTLFEASDGFRYYSLSTEPSYAAFIIIVLFFVYTEYVERQRENVWRGKHLRFALMCLYMIVSFQSGYGIILLGGFLFSKLSLKRAFAVVLAGLIIFFTAVFLELPAVERFTHLIKNFDIGNIESIREADLSASFRVLPFYYYAVNINPLNHHFYFGYGAGTSGAFLVPFLFKVPVENYQGGFLPQFIYDYGIIFFIIFAIFLVRESVIRIISFPSLVLLLMMTNANFNTQLFWFIITCFALNKWYARAAKDQVADPVSQARVGDSLQQT